MIKRTFLEKGVDYAGELSLQNVRDLYTILEWNNKNNIKCFRISSDIFPCKFLEYGIENSPYYKRIETILKNCVVIKIKHGIRITTSQIRSMYLYHQMRKLYKTQLLI